MNNFVVIFIDHVEDCSKVSNVPRLLVGVSDAVRNIAPIDGRTERQGLPILSLQIVVCLKIKSKLIIFKYLEEKIRVLDSRI